MRIGLRWATVLTWLAAVGLAAVSWVGLTYLFARRWPPWTAVDPGIRSLDVVRLALAIVAGTGGVVALVVAYRRQHDLEAGRFVERFGAAADQLGSNAPAVRLAGVYAMARVADEFHSRRQQAIDVLCAYLRLPYMADPGESALTEVQAVRSWPAGSGESQESRRYLLQPYDREVRNTILRIIRDHLRPGAPISWCGYDLDFTGAVFDGCDLSGVLFRAGRVTFERAHFLGEMTDFSGATFSTATSFEHATFTAGVVFDNARFDSCDISFRRIVVPEEGWVSVVGASIKDSRLTFGWSQIRGTLRFRDCAIVKSTIEFLATDLLKGSHLMFTESVLADANVAFNTLSIAGGALDFSGVDWQQGYLDLHSFDLDGGFLRFRNVALNKVELNLESAVVSNGHMDFTEAQLTESALSLHGATIAATSMTFLEAALHGAHIDFEKASLTDGSLVFNRVTLDRAGVSFDRAAFLDERVDFTGIDVLSGRIGFDGATYAGKTVTMDGTDFRGLGRA